MADECGNCRFYRPRVYGTATVYECRYADPFSAGQKGYWPEVKPDDWCGKWEAAPIAREENRRVELVS